MKLVRYGEVGAEKPGLIDEGGSLRDLAGEIADISPATVTAAGLAGLAALDPEKLPAVDDKPRFAPPLGGIGKVVCVGQNYVDHVQEMGFEMPTEPVIFIKANSALSGPFDPIIMPKTATKLDWEVELAVVIGQRANNVGEAEAMDHVFGYCLFNDVSERAFQREHGGGTTKGKSADSFGPLGPWLVTADEVADPQDLRLWTEINGVRRQDGNTTNMIFPVPTIISYVSRFMSLNPGDVVSTGSPHGAAAGFDPPAWLQTGDRVEMGIEALGTQSHMVVPWKE